jgi:ABC-type transport system involved in multi-copper enzyme maturation permease subunit
MLVLTCYLAALAAVVVTVLALTVSSTGTISPDIGRWLFMAMAVGSVLLVAFIAPALTASTVSGERERLTLDLLLVTRASSLGLVAGKLAGALLWILYLLLASFPVLGIVYLFGGVPFMTVAAALVVVGATALAYSALGLLVSAIFRRTVLASVVAYAVVLVTTIVLPIVAALLGFTPAFSSFSMQPGAVFTNAVVSAGAPSFDWPPVTAWLTFTSPVMALASVVGGGFGVYGYGFGSAPVGPFSVYIVRAGVPGPLNPQTITSFAPWVFSTAISVVFAIIALLLSAAALRPTRVKVGARFWTWRMRRKVAHGS